MARNLSLACHPLQSLRMDIQESRRFLGGQNRFECSRLLIHGLTSTGADSAARLSFPAMAWQTCALETP